MRKAFVLSVLLFWASLSFAQDATIRFAFVTDTHLGKASNHADFVSCMDDINAQDSLDFVLIGGDVTNFGTDKQIIASKKVFDKFRIPYWVVSGNHDSKWSESGCNTFVKIFGYEQFEFEAKGYRFMGCNCGPDMRMTGALVPRNSMNWLKSKEPDKPLIFLNHYPLDQGMNNWFEVRRELIRLNCRFAIAGHVHRNSIRNYDGLPGMTGRCSFKKKGVAGYNIVTIKDNVLTVSERSIEDGKGVTHEPWLVQKLLPVTDNVTYDEDGLPTTYPYMHYSDNANYPEVKVRWALTEDANIVSGFAADGKNAWYATASGKVVCIKLIDGSQVWTRQLPGKIYSTPAQSSGILVVPCTDGTVYAFDSTTGEDKWKCVTTKSIVASPTIFNKIVYVGGSDTYFRAIRLKDGKLLWSWSGVRGFCDGAPYVDKYQVLFTTWENRLFSVDPKAGTTQWAWATKQSAFYSPGSCTPIKVGDRVFIVRPDRRTYCFNTWTGEKLFVIDGGRESFAVSDDKKAVYVKCMDGKVFAFDPQIPLSEVNGVIEEDSPSKKIGDPGVPVLGFDKALWYVDSGMNRDIGSSALNVCGDLLLMPSDRGVLHALDRHTGKALWKHRVGVGLMNPVSSWKEGNKIVVLASTMDGKIELLEVSNSQ